jgi:hypothetical protein
VAHEPDLTYDEDDALPDPFEKPPLSETENLIWPLSTVALSTLTSKVGLGGFVYWRDSGVSGQQRSTLPEGWNRLSKWI